MNHRDLIQKAVTALEWVNDNTADEMPIVDAALFDLRAELAKPAAVPDGLPSDGTLPQHYVDGWNAARFAALGHPPALAVDVEAVRGTIFRMKDNHKLRESRCKPDPLISIWANELARAIGDKNDV